MIFQKIGKSNAQRQREWCERQKMFNREECKKKEIERVNAYKVKQNLANFKKKHMEATRKQSENKKAATESNLRATDSKNQPILRNFYADHLRSGSF